MGRGRKPRIIGVAAKPVTVPDSFGDDASTVDGDADSGSVGSIASDGTIVIEPRNVDGSADGATGSAEPVKRRGRKPGSKNSSKTSTLDISGIELLLYSSHNMLSILSKTPEIALSKEESNLLATAAVDVAKHYEVMQKVSVEAIAWVNLAQVAALIYGPRLMTFRMRKRPRRTEETQVYPFPSAGMTNG